MLRKTGMRKKDITIGNSLYKKNYLFTMKTSNKIALTLALAISAFIFILLVGVIKEDSNNSVFECEAKLYTYQEGLRFLEKCNKNGGDARVESGVTPEQFIIDCQ